MLLYLTSSVVPIYVRRTPICRPGFRPADWVLAMGYTEYPILVGFWLDPKAFGVCVG
jgi:hypothetical protein